VFFEACGLVSAVIPVTDVVFLFHHIFHLWISLHFPCQTPLRNLGRFRNFFTLIKIIYICSICAYVVLHTLSLCLFKCYFICWETCGFNFIRISVYALEQTVYVKCILRLLFWIFLVIFLNLYIHIFLYSCILTVKKWVDISTWLSVHRQLQNNKHD
jgi:hypothetical protein